jgi:hypothetical protein
MDLVERSLSYLPATGLDDAAGFAREHMRTEQGTRLSFKRARYLLPILLDERPSQVCIACAQSGKTVTYLGKTLWTLVCRRPEGFIPAAIYTFPTDTDVRDFSSARAAPMIDASPFLSDEFGHGRVDNQGVKAGRSGCTLYFRGTFTQRAAIAVPAGMLVHDELDRSDQAVVQLYSDRTRASEFPHRYVFSTPTVPKFGVSAEWAYSNQAEWMWRCGECNAEQCFAPMDKSSHWSAHLDVDDQVFRCASCGTPVERDWVVAGHWDKQAPENDDCAGYHITGIMPALASAKRLCAELQRAKYPELWTQGHIGLPEVSGDKQLTEDMIVFGDWPNFLKHDGPCYAGLDQGKKLDMVIGDGEGRIVAVHRYDDWSEVKAAMRAYRVRMLVIDSQPEVRAAQDVARQFPGRVLLADYSLKVIEQEPFDRVKGEPRVRIHRTAALDWGRDRILMGFDGGDVWPALPVDIEAALKAQLVAPQRTTVDDKHGNPTAEWVETGPDHLRHSHVYYIIAAAVCSKMKWTLHSIRQDDQRSELLRTALGESGQSLKPPQEDEVLLDARGRPVTRRDVKKLQKRRP